ncbi:MAG: nitroreductase family protein, partial [Kiritimatiellales bacterium]
LARLCPSGANLQPLKYFLSCDAAMNARIFPSLAWAGYLKAWDGPAEGERPAAYIVVLGDTEVSKNFGCDHGIAAQTILLGAAEKGLGGCMIGAVNRRALAETLVLPGRYEILLVLALGVSAETVRLVPAGESIQYYRDANDVHCVPKRSLADLLIN